VLVPLGDAATQDVIREAILNAFAEAEAAANSPPSEGRLRRPVIFDSPPTAPRIPRIGITDNSRQ
jgi:hypothetical protein